ncbi:hypothetical protein AB9P05_03910 [Roseivirga sp. BDSF3-8]|uniref:DUF6989 domain-containing protein n=1 Tax=Roseivirga sp. BDSF3-8 TaxID=3241598 RepID=UPI00353211DB
MSGVTLTKTSHKATEIPGLDSRTKKYILASTGALTLWSIFSSVLSAGAISAIIITFILYTFYWGYALVTKNPLVLRLLIFGTIAGLLELFADNYLVHNIDSLVYPEGELMIWSSPVYMPFAWSNVLTQLGFIGILLSRKYNLWVASALLAIAGGMYIPLYEYLAEGANWWVYKNNVIMIFNAPLYVILCEAFIAFSLPFLITYATRHHWQRTIPLGIAEGAWIMLGVIVTYAIAG